MYFVRYIIICILVLLGRAPKECINLSMYWWLRVSISQHSYPQLILSIFKIIFLIIYVYFKVIYFVVRQSHLPPTLFRPILLNLECVSWTQGVADLMYVPHCTDNSYFLPPQKTGCCETPLTSLQLSKEWTWPVSRRAFWIWDSLRQFRVNEVWIGCWRPKLNFQLCHWLELWIRETTLLSCRQFPVSLMRLKVQRLF